MKTLLLISTLLFSVGANAEENFIPEEAAPTVEEALVNSESPLEYHSSNMFEIPSQTCWKNDTPKGYRCLPKLPPQLEQLPPEYNSPLHWLQH